MQDLINRQAAIDAIANCTNCGDEKTLRAYVQKHNLDNGWTGGVLEAIDAIEDLPSAQSEEVTPHRNYKYLSDYWCECGNHLGKKGSVTFCSDCGRKVKWDE